MYFLLLCLDICRKNSQMERIQELIVDVFLKTNFDKEQSGNTTFVYSKLVSQSFVYIQKITPCFINVERQFSAPL